MRRLFWIPLLALVGIASAAYTESAAPSLNAERAKQVVTQTRRQFIEANMEIPDAQKDAFWTIYKAYEDELAPVAQQTGQLSQEYTTDYTTLTNAQVMEMMKGSSASNKKAIDLRYKYAEQIGKKVGPKLGARFFQLDDYYTTATRLARLDNIGFVGDQK